MNSFALALGKRRLSSEHTWTAEGSSIVPVALELTALAFSYPGVRQPCLWSQQPPVSSSQQKATWYKGRFYCVKYLQKSVRRVKGAAQKRQEASPCVAGATVGSTLQDVLEDVFFAVRRWTENGNQAITAESGSEYKGKESQRKIYLLLSWLTPDNLKSLSS